MNPIGSVRVGRIQGKKQSKFSNFTPIVVMTKSSKYGDIGPYVLRDEHDRILENVWQFSKVYPKVPKSRQIYSRWDARVIWEWPSEVHVDENDEPNDAYWEWRYQGMNASEAVRYPVGYQHRGEVIYSIWGDERLSYVEARKKIYLPIYCRSVRKTKTFYCLRKKLDRGENLLILEVDGPHQESLGYYREKYGVEEDFIVNGTMLATKGNLEVMLNDEKHSFGHGYCLAMALLDLDEEI